MHTLDWQWYMEQARSSVHEIEVLTFRINNGGRDWSAGDVKTRSVTIKSPTESAAIMELTVVPQLVDQRGRHEKIVGDALAAIQKVRERLGTIESDILEMFYIDRFLSWEIAGELGLTVDSVFYRKRKALQWMNENLTIPT